MSDPSDAPPPSTSGEKPGIVRRLYDWVLHWAETPYGGPALAILCFAEASFFPLPPDPLLIALCLGAIRRSFRSTLDRTRSDRSAGTASRRLLDSRP